MTNEFATPNPLEEAVRDIIQGSHLANNTFHFAPVAQTLAGNVINNSDRAKFPFVVADFTMTGFNQDLVFGDLTVTVIDLMPDVEDYHDLPTYHEAIRAKKARYQLDLYEIAQILLGRRMPDTRQPLYDYGINGTSTMTVSVDPPDQELREGFMFRLMEAELVLPLKGGMGELTGVHGTMPN